jgi:hypothetical protein
MLIRYEKIEIFFSQNNLLIRVQSVRLEFLLPLKTNLSPFIFISLSCDERIFWYCTFDLNQQPLNCGGLFLGF